MCRSKPHHGYQIILVHDYCFRPNTGEEGKGREGKGKRGEKGARGESTSEEGERRETRAWKMNGKTLEVDM